MSEHAVLDAHGRAVGDLRLHPGDRLVVVDLKPRANWAHPCVYAVIAPDGQVRTAVHDWPPAEDTLHVFVSLPDAMVGCSVDQPLDGARMGARLRTYLALEDAMLDLDRAGDPLADSIRDAMDPLWDALTDEDRTWLSRRPPCVQHVADLTAKLQPEAVAAEAAKAAREETGKR